MSINTLVNIAPLSKVEISSSSKWSTKDDSVRVVSNQSVRDYAFHTEKEKNPWLILSFEREVFIKDIKVLNRRKCHERANEMSIDYSVDGVNYINVHRCVREWLEISIDISKRVRFIKLKLNSNEYFHLNKVELYTFVNEFFMYFDKPNPLLSKIFTFLINEKSEYNLIAENENLLYLFEKNCSLRYKIEFKNLSWSVFLLIANFKYIDLLVNFFQKIQNDYPFVTLQLSKNEILIPVFHLNKEEAELFCKNVYGRIYNWSKYFDDVVFQNFYNSLDRNNQKVIIDSDALSEYGFSDRIRGVLSVISICNELGLEYLIKFEKPFKLSKYYVFKEHSGLLKNLPSFSIKISTSQFYKAYSNFRHDIVYDCIQSLSFCNCQTVLGTNYLINFNSSTFKENFKRTEYFEQIIQDYINKLNFRYITISLRFLSRLGDFNEPGYEVLEQTEQVELIEKCRNEIIDFINVNKISCSVLILSDSAKFLNSLNGIPNLFYFPDNIFHLKDISSEMLNGEEYFLKILIDFNLIMGAENIYRFESEYLYNTNFPLTAAICAGKKLLTHKF